MRLSSLKLAGFKSFAESTTFYFKDSRTAIVGPNGCGKSNVIDAIRWVMGESNARQLRGGQMQDVIFAGTSQRKPVGLASVELRFENTQGKLGGAYNAYAELSVKRQVNRDGKSDYFLNGTRCRRKDITDIFLGTGLGPRSYAVIEQGMINRLIDAKPDEMRIFIEEAAGISRYQARRKETLQHLEHTQNNLSRLNDIALELFSQIKTLKRQSEQAEKYHQLKQNIHIFKVQLLSHEYYKITQQVDVFSQQLAQLNTQYQSEHKALEQLEIDWQLQQQQLQQQLPQAEQLQQTWQQAQQQYQQLQWQLQQDQLQSQHTVQDLQKIMQQYQQLQDDDARNQRGLVELIQQISKIQYDLSTSEQVEKHAREDYTRLQTKSQQKQQVFEQELKDLTQLQQQEQQLNYQLQQLQKTIQRSKQALEQHQQQNNSLQDDTEFELDELNIELASAQIKLQDAQQQEQALSGILQQQLKQKEDLYKQHQELSILQKNLQRELQQTEKLLAQLQSEQVIQAKQPLLQQLQLTYQGQLYQHLIERILDKWLFAETTNILDLGYQGQSQIRLHDAVLVENRFDLPAMTTWISYPLHPLWQSIYIAQHVEEAQQYLAALDAGSSIVTEDGYWFGVDWWVNLNVTQNQAGQGQLHYHLHQQELQQKRYEVSQQLEILQPQLNQLIDQSAITQQQLQNIQQHSKQLEQQQQKLLQQQVRLQAILQQREKNSLQSKQQIAQLTQQLNQDTQEQKQLACDLADLQRKIEQKQPLVATQQQQSEQMKNELLQYQQQLQQDQAQIQEYRLTLQQHQTQQALLEQDQQFKQQRLTQLSEQIIDINQQLQRLQQVIADTQLKENDAKIRADQQQQLWLNWQNHIEQLQQQQQQSQLLRSDKQQQENQLRDQLETVRLQWQQFKTEQQHLLQQLQQLDENEIKQVQVDVVKLQHQLEKAQQQLEKVGSVNLAAFEELQQLQGRYDELNHQMQDLDHTVQQLQDAMKSIDQETKHLFMKTFEQVNHELQDLFPKIFTGGEASLTLENGWQSGVRLMARPPGKRNSSLALLSGGEKALTALALVFAIFRLNPAPFCVLDEVDAPLDDANVNRFCNLVKELSQQVQFIYITHNKLAMTMATDLLGVTMPEAGSSKLVAVSLAQAEAYGMMME